MPVVGWSIHLGDAEKEAMIQVKEGDVVRDMKFLPLAARPIEVFEYRVRSDASSQASCQRWMRAE